MFIWDFVADTILEQIMDWVYKQIIGFLANFFAEMGNMGAEMFEMSWVQSIVRVRGMRAGILVRQSRCERDRHESHQGIHGGQSFYGCTDQAL